MVSVAASEFWTKATRCETAETLHELFLTFAQALGFHSAMFINLSNAGGPVLPRVVLGDMDPWIAYYTEQNFARLDPTIPMAFRSRTPFTWRSVERPDAPRPVRNFFGEARAGWADEGLIVPIHGPFAEFSVVNLLCDQPIKLSGPDIAVVQAACQLYVTLGLTLATGALPLPFEKLPALTKRELQCLYWVCVGKHDVETGKILGISANTVRGYIDSTKVKLGVETRAELSIRAQASGLLVPDRQGLF